MTEYDYDGYDPVTDAGRNLTEIGRKLAEIASIEQSIIEGLTGIQLRQCGVEVGQVAQDQENAFRSETCPQQEANSDPEDRQRAVNWDKTTIEHALGIELGIDVSEPPEEYSERYQIALDVCNALDAMRDNVRTVAENLGVEISKTDYENWRPSEPEVAKLNADLRRQRKNITIMNGLEHYVQQMESGEPEEYGVPLTPRQRITVENTLEFLENDPRTSPEGGKAGLIDKATGTGKTGVLAKIVAAAKGLEDPSDPVTAVVVTPSLKIHDQTIGRPGDRGFGLFAPHLPVGERCTGRQGMLTGVVDVMPNETYYRLLERGELGDYDIVIHDEAHTTTSERAMRNDSEYCKNRIAIGCTATPDYSQAKTARRTFPHQIDRYPLVPAIRCGDLAPTTAYEIEVEPQIDWEKIPEDPNELERMLNAAHLEARKSKAIDIAVEEIEERGVGVIIRCPAGGDIHHAKDVAVRLRDRLTRDHGFGGSGFRWIEAEAVGGTDQPLGVRARIFNAHDEGELDVIVAVDAVRMGVDSTAGTLINVDPCTSKLEMEQVGGRVVRLIRRPDGTPQRARIYDFKARRRRNKQWTMAKILGTQSGEEVGLDPNAAEDHPISRRQERIERQRAKASAKAEIIGVIAETVGAITVENETKPDLDRAKAAATLNALDGDVILNRADAQRILGVSPPTYDQIMHSLGTPPGKRGQVSVDDLKAILELFPGMKAPLLPDDGHYARSDDVAAVISRAAGKTIRQYSLQVFARTHGILPSRYTGADGRVGSYYTPEQIQDLLRMAEERGYEVF